MKILGGKLGDEDEVTPDDSKIWSCLAYDIDERGPMQQPWNGTWMIVGGNGGAASAAGVESNVGVGGAGHAEALA